MAYAWVQRLDGEVMMRCPVALTTCAPHSPLACCVCEHRSKQRPKFRTSQPGSTRCTACKAALSASVGLGTGWDAPECIGKAYAASSSKTTAIASSRSTICSQTRRCVRAHATVNVSCGERPESPKARSVLFTGISTHRLTTFRSTSCSRLSEALATAGTKSTVGFHTGLGRSSSSACITCCSVSLRCMPTANTPVRAKSGSPGETALELWASSIPCAPTRLVVHIGGRLPCAPEFGRSQRTP
eukprot:scaffold11484_cov125-Isochrysis_galbana.AAC.1